MWPIRRGRDGPIPDGRSLDPWAYFNGVSPDFSRPGKPTDKAFIERLNGRLRQECLDDARAKIESWRSRYNREYDASPPHRMAVLEPLAVNAPRMKRPWIAIAVPPPIE